MKTSLTDSQLVDEWSGTTAQLKCNVSIADVANSDEIPTLSDVNAAFSNATSVRIITRHLQSVLQFSGVDLTDAQLAETALAILANYWYLNLAELCLFFVQLKAGSRGQFVWGSKINNQAIMVALNDFCRDRRTAIEAIESKRIRDSKELVYNRIDTTAAALVVGQKQFQEFKEKSKEDIYAFYELFPYLPEILSPEEWWKAWKGNPSSLKLVYGENVPPVEIAQEDIGRYLCEYSKWKIQTNG